MAASSSQPPGLVANGHGDVTTRGNGGDTRGGGGDDSSEEADAASAVASAPSWAGTHASAFAIGVDAREISCAPQRGGQDPEGFKFDGDWGGTSAPGPTPSVPGTFGVICGNSGGGRQDSVLKTTWIR